jgi:hypothetical protein
MSLFPGELFEGLATFLSREFDQVEPVKVDVVVHALPASVRSQNTKADAAASDLVMCHDTMELDQLQSILLPKDGMNIIPGTKGRAAIVFMQGHQPPQCLTRLGAMLNISPVFFQRHLEYLWSSRPLKLFSSPSLPSASFNTIRLRVVTLGETAEKSGSGSHTHLHALRQKHETAMANYLHDLTREYKLCAGNSIVRSFNVHSTRYFSIEQEVSIAVQTMNNNWVCLIWTDIGQNLTGGPKGPWQLDRPGYITEKSRFLPTIQHLPSEAANRPPGLMIPDPHRSQGSCPQSASLLAKNYGLTLDPCLLATDSFYALTELFQFSANSICQLLNLIEFMIDESTGKNLYNSPDDSLSRLSYHLDILNRFENRLSESIFDLEHHQSSKWPRMYDEKDATSANKRSKAIATADALLVDFKRLLSRAEHLSARCQSGMAICMNSASIAESKRAISQAQQVDQLTRLAFFYIPLSFTASFFGMNVTSFGTGTLHLWSWFAVSVPLVIISYAVLAFFSGRWI